MNGWLEDQEDCASFVQSLVSVYHQQLTREGGRDDMGTYGTSFVGEHSHLLPGEGNPMLESVDAL